ncbi:MAG: hypothetical protein QOI61_2399 [Actinomycetota bacterium]
MGLPNVLVIGAQKCGTTGLYALLDRHPQCVVGRVKESHFFVDEAPQPFGNWTRGVEWYESLYDHDAPIVADISPSYAGWPLNPGVPERASTVVPDATIVMLVRDPIDRIVSNWRHWVWRGYESRPFTEAVLDPDPRNRYVIGSLYATQLKRWLAYYRRDYVLVLHQDEVRAGAVRLFQHFGLPPVADASVTTNVSDEMRIDRFPALPKRLARRLPRGLVSRAVPRPVLDESTRSQLRARLAPDVAEFAALTGIDFS